MRHSVVTDKQSRLETAADGTREWLQQPIPLADKLGAFFAACCASRDYGTWDAVETEFLQLALDTGLTGAIGEDEIKTVIARALVGDLEDALLQPVALRASLIDFWRTCHAARALAGLSGYAAIEVALMVLADSTGLAGAAGEAEVCRIIRCAMRDEFPFDVDGVSRP
jgi:hypothetical protein